MKEYVFWYSETITYKAGFEAKNKKQAEALLIDVFEGYKHITELPEFWENDKSNEFEYSPETLEEIGLGK